MKLCFNPSIMSFLSISGFLGHILNTAQVSKLFEKLKQNANKLAFSNGCDFLQNHYFSFVYKKVFTVMSSKISL